MVYVFQSIDNPLSGRILLSLKGFEDFRIVELHFPCQDKHWTGWKLSKESGYLHL